MKSSIIRSVIHATLLTLAAQAGVALAEPSKPVSVVADGMAPFSRDMSLDEVRGKARDEARRNAIEQAVGVFVRGTTVLHNSQIADELISSVARGVIEEEEWLEERLEEVKETKDAKDSRDKKDKKTTRPSMAIYHAKVKALVRPVHVERRAGFHLQASLNKTVFQEGEEALVKIKSSQPSHLYLFSVTQDGSVTLLLPNHYLAQNLIAAGQEMSFPSEALRALGVKLRVMLPKGAKKAVEYIKIIAIKKPITLIQEHNERAPGSVFHTFDGMEGGMIYDVVKRLASLEDEDWTEATLPYEVRQ